MWRTLWRSIDRFSLQHFKYIISELLQIKAVDRFNKELVIDLLQSVVEIVTYGDRHDPAIFEYFMEYQVLGEFVRLLKNSRHSRIEAPLLQYLSIMLQNMESEQAIYYCLSNDYINSIITHQFQFEAGDLAPYYISFLRAVSSKLNRDTLCLLVKVHEDAVVSFPLYSEALKFAHHGEKMIQTAVRALTLNIYNVSDDMVFQYVTTPPVSVYFSDLVLSIKKQLINLDNHVQATEGSCPHERMREKLTETDKIVDDLYYLDDVIRVGESRLNKLVISNLVDLMVLPMLISLLQLGQRNGTFLSGVTSLVVIARLLQIFQEENLINFVASAILFADMSSSKKNASEQVANGGAKYDVACLESKFAELFKRNHLLEHLSSYWSPDSPFANSDCKYMLEERTGMMSHILSDDKQVMLASLMLLLVVAESKGLDYRLAHLMGFCQTNTTMPKRYDSSDSQVVDGISFARHLPQILHALLVVLASLPPYCVSMQWQAGWFFRKLLVFQGYKLDGDDVHLFNFLLTDVL